MKKHIYLVQAGCLYGNTYYLPYAVGMLAAFAFDNKTIREEYCLKRIIYSLEDIDEAIQSMENPCFVGFSNSIWNYKYNLEFAAKLKKQYPNCIIEFGGHHVPPTTEFLEKYDFIDYLIFRKGEEAFRDLLLSLIDGGLSCSDIPNIAYRDDNGNPIMTPEKEIRICDYPSPYLNGIFDDILKNGEYPFSCVLETNRGCPYNCSYCDWGELNSPVRLFPLEKVFAELEWMSKNKMEFVYCVDANFGMFERDELIAQKLVDLKEESGYPNRLQVSYAKNEHLRTFRINKLLADYGIGKGATLALQSLEPEVLKNVGRVNISKEEYAQSISRYRNAGISTYTELILGLPGETYDSFCHGLCETLELGQHSSVSAYLCELLPNSRLSRPENIEKYKIRTVSSSLNQYHCEVMDDVLSGASSIIVATDTMTVDEWIKANEFSTCLQSFHHFGLLQCFAMYIRHEIGISYYDFYTELNDYVKHESAFCKPIFDIVTNILRGFTEDKCGLTYQNDIFGKITYPVEEAVFLLILYEKEKFYKDILSFLRRYIKDEKILEELIVYQIKNIICPGDNEHEADFSFDFYNYFESILQNSYIPLQKRDVRYRFSTSFKTFSWEEYAKEIIWYGRRNSRMMFSSKPNVVEELK